MAARGRYGGWFVAGCGLLLWSGFLWYFLDERHAHSVLWPPLLALLLGTALSVGLVYAGHQVAADDRVGWSEARHVLAWGAGGLLVWVALRGLTVLVRLAEGHPVADARLSVLTSAGGGLLGGVLLGYLHVGARLDAARARETQEAVGFLNRTLRHEMLNGLNVIQGAAARAEENCDCGESTPLDTIHCRSEDLAEFVGGIRAFARTFADEAEMTAVDVGDVLRRRAASVREEHPDAVVEVDVPADVDVRANETVRYVFRNLLENAVEHNDGGAPHVHVTADVTADSVAVHVADDGPGIPDGRKAAVFEPELDQEHRLGLYLARTLVTHYGGDIRLADNEPRGTVVTVELPRAD